MSAGIAAGSAAQNGGSKFNPARSPVATGGLDHDASLESMAAPFTESARKETPHTLHVNLVSFEQFLVPERLLAPQDTKKHHP